MPQIPDAIKKEAKVIFHGVISAIVAGALIGILHYFGIPVPASLTIPTMAIGGYAGAKLALVKLGL